MKKLLLLYCFTGSVAFAQTDPAAQLSVWKDSVIGTLYNAKTSSVAYGRKDKADYYKIFIADSLGNNEKQLTWHEWSPDRHQWPEEWDPSGEYLYCYIEKTEYVKEKKHKRKPVDAIPGYGAYTDLWIIKRDGSQAWKIVDVPNSYNNGIIHSAVSPDGTKFAWSERIKAPKFGNFNLMAGSYVMKVADVVMEPTPHFENIKSYQPGGVDACNELESFSPDNKHLTFYSTFESKNLFATPIYIMNLESGTPTKLTTESFAQAAMITPKGNQIIYMTGAGCDRFPGEVQGADWWIMDLDGSNKQRLTYMNFKNHQQSDNHYRLAGSLSFVNDHQFLGGVMTKPLGLTGYTAIVDFSAFVK